MRSEISIFRVGDSTIYFNRCFICLYMWLFDAEGLLECLSAAVAHPSLPAVEHDISSLVGDDDTETRQMRAVAVAVLAVLDSLSEVT